MAANEVQGVRLIDGWPHCPNCSLGMLPLEDRYACILCGWEWVPGPKWVGDLWADEMRYKRSISERKGGSRKAGRKRSRSLKPLRWRREEDGRS